MYVPMFTGIRINLKVCVIGCCVERIYIHSSIYDDFVKRFVDIAKGYKLGDPSKVETTLGPVISLASAARIRKQVKDAGECDHASLSSAEPLGRLSGRACRRKLMPSLSCVGCASPAR